MRRVIEDARTPTSVIPDSAVAVTLAKRMLRCESTDSLGVSEFERDSDGVHVTLQPKQSYRAGGGGKFIVGRGRAIRIVELYQ
jgi:hypothetical protein